MGTVELVLLGTLEKLGREEFKNFKGYLQLPGIYSGFTPLPKARLEEANQMETVTLMVQKYTHHVVEVTKTVLRQMNKNELVQHLSGTSSQLRDEEMDRLQPPQQQILQFQRTMQQNLHSKFIGVQEGLADRTEAENLKEIFIKLYITDGAEIQINEQHELTLIRNTGMGAGAESPIEPSDIFSSPKGIPLRTVLTTGVAGIGKTILVKNFVLDWAETTKNQDVHLVFPFSFSELNIHKGKKFSLAELIHWSIWEFKAISEKDLNLIFANLQASGCRDFNRSQYKLLFVLDGLDESRLQLDLSQPQPQPLDFEVTQSTTVEVLLTALINGTLLPSSRVWITSRPAAASHIHPDSIHRVTVVRGFSDPQKEEYFRRKFPDEEQASKIILHIKESRSLFIMCHIPVFCLITTTVLRNVLKNKTKMDLPTTLTQMYTEFLMYQITQTGKRCGEKQSTRYIKSLAKLAFDHLEGCNIFYDKDLNDRKINFHKASQDFGMFTEVPLQVPEGENKDKGKMYRFVHMTVLEYLAALHVVMSLFNDNKNVLAEQRLRLEDLCLLCRRKTMNEVHVIAIQRALSTNGYLDLFLRFLMGLSLESSQDRLKCLLHPSKEFPQTNHQDTIMLIKTRLKENTSAEKCINLFHCLHELRDDSLVNEIQENLKSGHLSPSRLSPTQRMALVFILVSSEETQEVFDLKKYCPSDEGLLMLMPVVKASNKSLLSSCNLSERVCGGLASVLSSPASRLTELDLSDNDLQDSGLKRLCVGLESPKCALQVLRLSGCMISDKGCTALVSALKSNPSHLRELDLRFNHPKDSGVKALWDLVRDSNYRLETIDLDHRGEHRLTTGVRKYICDLTLDDNTAQRNLKLSDDSRTVTTVEEAQPHRHHPERFDCWLQVLSGTGLTGRCYWEVKWNQTVYVAMTYKGIIRKGEGADSCLGANAHSWTLLCHGDGSYSVRHQSRTEPVRVWPSPESQRVGVYLDFDAGTLSFYKVTSEVLVPIHTFRSTFTEPLYPALGFGFRHGFRNFGSKVSLCSVEEVAVFSCF